MQHPDTRRDKTRRRMQQRRMIDAHLGRRTLSVTLDSELASLIDDWKAKHGHPNQAEALSDILRRFQQGGSAVT